MFEHAGFESFRADVIQKEKWARTQHRNVVYAMIYQIDAHGVVLIRRKRDLQFGADAIDACHQNRLAHFGKIRAKQSPKTAHFAEHLWAMCLLYERLNLSLQPVAKIDVYTRARVCLLFFIHRFHRFRRLVCRKNLCESA